jgi:hypothetical protein
VNQVLKTLELAERACKLRRDDPKCSDRAKHFAFKNWRFDQSKQLDRFTFYSGLCTATDEPEGAVAAVGNHEQCWESMRRNAGWAEDREIITRAAGSCTVVSQLWNTRHVTEYNQCIRGKIQERMAAGAL